MTMMSMEPKELFDTILTKSVAKGASDLHLTSDDLAFMRIHGRLVVQEEDFVGHDDLNAIFLAIMTERQRQDYETRLTVDLGYTNHTGERFRLNCYREMGRPALACRHLNQNMLSLEQLRLPKELTKLAYLKSGLVLVTGVTGSGKSTTLAALLNEINQKRDCHIMTVEDPVEFVHKNAKSLVHHRELFTDVPDYADAVRAFMREDPDVILIGEMRDLETMKAAIVAAETGHLVFSTLHTGEAVGAVERFIGYFPGDEQGVARHRIALVLRAVIAQQLLPKPDGQGQVPVVELLKINTAVATMIENSKTRQIQSVMEGGAADGMWTFDQALAKLVRQRLVAKDTALSACRNTTCLECLLRRTGRC